MELGLLASIAYFGNKGKIVNDNKDYSNSNLHKIKFKYNNDKYNENKNTIADIAEKKFIESHNPKNTNIINNTIKHPNQINKISSNNKIMDNSKFYNNSISYFFPSGGDFSSF